MSERSYSREEIDEIIQDYLRGIPGTELRTKYQLSVKALVTMMRKLAIGYPPADELFAIPVEYLCRSTEPFRGREIEMIQQWWQAQTEFNDPRMVEYYRRSQRTRDYKRPTVTYFCAVLRRHPDELREFCMAHFLDSGKGFGIPLVCPVPEWQ